MEKGLAEMLRCERPGDELRKLVWKVVCVVPTTPLMRGFLKNCHCFISLPTMDSVNTRVVIYRTGECHLIE